jgi:hypothetical protein
MKQPFIFLVFLICSIPLFAQKTPDKVETLGNRRLETYRYAEFDDSVRYTIEGLNDTVLIEHWNYNGTPLSKTWRLDSSYRYNGDGSVSSKSYFLKKGVNHYFYQGDSTVIFYPNGQVNSLTSSKPSSLWSKQFDKNGRLTKEYTVIISPFHLCVNERNGEGILVYSGRKDTIFRQKDSIARHSDSLFYPNGRLKMVKILDTKWSKNAPMNYRSYEPFASLPPHIRYDIYDADGKLVSKIPPDSLALQIFKDNIDCYYGFKNGRGDTIIAPRFDHILSIDIDHFAAYEGDICQIYRADGTRLAASMSLSDAGKVFEMGKIELIRDYQNEYMQRFSDKNDGSELSKYFFVKVGSKIGLIDREGKTVIPPQYDASNWAVYPNKRLWEYGHSANYVGDADFLEVIEWEKALPYNNLNKSRSVFLNRKGEPVFDKQYKGVQYAEFKDYFKVSENFGVNDRYYQHQLVYPIGLADGQGKLVLAEKFSNIKNLYFTPLFVADLNNGERQGLFDTRLNRWILDTTHFQIFTETVNVYKPSSRSGSAVRAEKQNFIVFKNLTTQKFGLLDIEGQPVLSAEYDTLAILNGKESLFWYKKGSIYRILDLKTKQTKRTDYSFLQPFPLPSMYEIPSYFIAQKNDKWGIIKAEDEQIVLPFIFDYLGLGQGRDIVAVKNQQATHIYNVSFPKASRHFIVDNYGNSPDKSRETFGFNSAENLKKIFFTDREGRVLIPPQYRQLSKKDDYARFTLVESDKKERKIVFLDKAKVVDFPFDYELEVAESNSKVLVVSKMDTSLHFPFRDFLPKKLGVVSTNGQLLAACDNFAVAIGDAERGVYFVKKSIPPFDTTKNKDDYYVFCNDTFNIEDNDWLMFDAEGKQLSETPLRMPISFKNGVGVGIKGDKFGIFRADGSTFLPPQYPMIWRDDSTGLYAVYTNVGLIPSLTLMDYQGKKRIEAGRYDGISPFFGKYALVASAGKIGLVDTFGTEIIAPQDLRSSASAFVDSLYLVREALKKMGYLYWKDKNLGLPFHFLDYLYLPSKNVHPDSLNIAPPLRNALWNLLLYKHLDRLVHYVGDLKFSRTPFKVNPENKEKYGYRVDCRNTRMTTQQMAASENFISFVIDSERKQKDYYNFYHQNNRWTEIQATDFWKTDADSRNQFYNLLVKKIRQLKDADIDCSNLTDLVDRTQSQFSVSEAGVSFSLDARQGYRFSFAVVVFSWEEVKPFLKMSLPNR